MKPTNKLIFSKLPTSHHITSTELCPLCHCLPSFSGVNHHWPSLPVEIIKPHPTESFLSWISRKFMPPHAVTTQPLTAFFHEAEERKEKKRLMMFSRIFFGFLWKFLLQIRVRVYHRTVFFLHGDVWKNCCRLCSEFPAAMCHQKALLRWLLLLLGP